MSLTKDAQRIFDDFYLEHGELDLFACVALRVEVQNGYLLPSSFVVDREPDDAFDIAFNCGHLGNVGAKRRCLLKAGRAANGTQCARVPCEEAAAEQVQGFHNIVGCAKARRIEEGLELLLHSL